MKPITGTFLDEITWDIPSQNWGKHEWRKEFDTMKETGIDTVIIIRSGLRDMAIFPSETLGIRDVPDLAQMFLDEAHRCGMKLFFGSYDSGTLDWAWKNWHHDWDVCKKFLPEVKKRYGQHPAFHGWYIAPETCTATEGAIEIYKRFSGFMKELDPEKPVLISPYYPSLLFRELEKSSRHKTFVDEWHRIFAAAPGISVAAFQDTSCSAKPIEEPLDELLQFSQEVHSLCQDHKVTCWNNCESFGRTYPIRFPPIDWRLLKRKMEIVDPYCEKVITFEFSHFMSPNSTWPSARLLYQRYREDILGISSR